MSEITSSTPTQSYFKSYPEPTFSKCKLWTYVITISLGAFQLGYALGIYSPISLVLMTLYGEQGSAWSLSHKQPYNTLVNTVLYIGAFIGTLVAYLFVGKRRNYGIYIFNGFCIVGGVLTAILNLPVLFIGRVVHGLGAGCLTYLIPIMINQVSPPHIRGNTSIVFQIQLTLAILIAALFGLGLPHYTYQIQESNMLWRVMAAFPVLVGIIHILLTLIFYRLDTPQKYLQENNSSLALKALKYVYTQEGAEIRLKQLEQQVLSDRASSLSDMGVRGNAPKALMVCFMLAIWQQFTGINAIIFYSSQIFGSTTNEQDIYSGLIVAVLVGSVNFGATIIALLFVERLGRRVMLVVGFGVMCVCEVLTGIFQKLEMTVPQQVALLVFIAAYEFSIGPLLWLYMPEVLNNAGVRVGANLNWIFVVVISFITPQLAKLNEWMFFIFAILNALGFVFLLVFLIESKGKSRVELQAMYSGAKLNSTFDLVSEGEKTPLTERQL